MSPPDRPPARLVGAPSAARRAAFAAAARLPVYATGPWLDFLEQAVPAEYRHFAVARGDVLAGTLSAALIRTPAGPIVNALPWFGTPGSAWLADAGDVEARGLLLGALAEWAGAEDALVVALVLTPEEAAAAATDYAAGLGAQTTDARIGQVTTLPDRAAPSLDDVLTLAHVKTRNLIRKAFKQGFSLEVAAEDDAAAWAGLVRLHAETMRAKGAAPKPPAHFAALRARLPPDLRTLLLARTPDGGIAAALLLAHHGDHTEYLVPAIDVRFRERQALSFLIAHGMLAAMAAGRRQWNWGGTWLSQTSLHHFKAGWGAVDRPYHYVLRGRAHARATLAAHWSALRADHPYFYLWPAAELAA